MPGNNPQMGFSRAAGTFIKTELFSDDRIWFRLNSSKKSCLFGTVVMQLAFFGLSIKRYKDAARKVSMSILKKSLNPKELERLRKEYQILSSLDHQNIVKFLSVTFDSSKELVLTKSPCVSRQRNQT